MNFHHLRWAILAALFTSSNLHADTFTVTRTNISGPGSLPVIINQANATPGDNVIEFAVTGTIGLAAPLPTITNNLTINGGDSGIVISGGGLVGLIGFAAGTTSTISRLTLTGGYEGTESAGAVSNAGTLLISGCVITNNRAWYGAILSKGSMTVYDSVVSNNRGEAGGGIRCEGTGYTTIVRSSFLRNETTNSPGGGGGGAAIYNVGTELRIAESFLYTNNAQYDGGAVFSSGPIVVLDSALCGNRSNRGSGGAIYHRSGSIVISNTLISGNRATNDGGGVYAVFDPYSRERTILRNVTMSDNMSIGGSGGAVIGSIDGCGVTLMRNATSASGGGLVAWDGTSLTNCTISGNRSGSGGGIDGSGNFQLVNCTVTSNQASNVGGLGVAGGIYGHGNGTLLNTIVAGNSARNSSPDLNGTFTSVGFNLIGNNQGASGLSINDYQNEPASLGPLQDNGGPTWTHALLQGSLAIGGGTSVGAPTADQRGILRPAGRCDIGAFQLVTLITPTITWQKPSDIVWGTALSGAQLNAAVEAAGTLAYTPPAGTILPVGSNQTLTVVFTPSDLIQYTRATNSVLISVIKTNQTITFNPIADQQIGSPPIILNATASSGLSVSFNLVSGPASLVGNLLTFGSATGTVTVAAFQAGNTNFNPAPGVERSFYVGNQARPVITVQPTNQTVYPGDRVMLSVEATNAPLSYQWQFGSGDIQGEKSPTLVLSRVKSSQHGQYRVIVTNPAGSVTSAVATLTVVLSPGTPAIVIQPQSQVVRTNESAVLYVVASGNAPLSYQWYRGLSGNTNAPIAGATNSSHTASSLATNTSFWVSVHNLLGTVDSTTANLMVLPAKAARLRGGRVSGFGSIVIDGVVGTFYQIDYSPDLNPTNWIPLISFGLPSNPYTFIDSGSIGVTQRFYRVVAP